MKRMVFFLFLLLKRREKNERKKEKISKWVTKLRPGEKQRKNEKMSTNLTVMKLFLSYFFLRRKNALFRRFVSILVLFTFIMISI